ncbi:MAG: hypothetical protein HC865_04080 [Cyanobacteria bacterium RU_5_0]|nr:hypothetical protein [Cyanobacteria bacterium RU_5_0]
MHSGETCLRRSLLHDIFRLVRIEGGYCCWSDGLGSGVTVGFSNYGTDGSTPATWISWF